MLFVFIQVRVEGTSQSLVLRNVIVFYIVCNELYTTQTSTLPRLYWLHFATIFTLTLKYSSRRVMDLVQNKSEAALTIQMMAYYKWDVYIPRAFQA